MFQAENLMSLGPPLAAEASLGIQYQRADLFNTMAKATDMEKNLIRAVTPVIRISRLVYSGTGQFSFRGHSIGFANGAMDVAWNLPRTVDKCGTQLICDPGENYKNDPEMARLMHARRALVHHLLCLTLVLNSGYRHAYGTSYVISQENLDAIPESGIPDGIPVIFEDKQIPALATVGAYSLNTSVLALWFEAGESDPEDYPIASRAYNLISSDYNIALDSHALAQDIQGNPRAAPMQEITKISQIVSFFLRHPQHAHAPVIF